MMKTIYAFGCSVTHGAELASVNASEENVLGSYPVKIAQRLKLQCENWAIPGNSNENIFHNFMTVIPQAKDIAFVIVGWTSPIRETWIADGRLWQFIPGWCASMMDNTKEFTHVRDPKPKWTELAPRMVSDGQEFLSLLEQQYDFLSRYKWDINEYLKKREHYAQAVRAYCSSHGIKLIETVWYDYPLNGVGIDLSSISDWLKNGRHPSYQEHETIADMIIKHYKL